MPRVQAAGEKTPHGAGLHVHETVPVGEPEYGGVSATVAVQLVDLCVIAPQLTLVLVGAEL